MFAPHPGQTIDTGYVISRAFELVFERPREVAIVALAGVLLPGLLVFGIVSVGVFNNALWEAVGIDGVMHPIGALLLLLTGWALALLVQTPLVGSAIEVHTDRRGLFDEFMRRGLTSFRTIFGATALVFAAVVVVVTIALGLAWAVLALGDLIPWDFVALMFKTIGTLVVALLVLRLVVSFYLLAPIIVVEHRPVAEALRRCWEIGWPNGLPILSAMFLPALVVQVVLFLASFLPWYFGLGAALVLGTGLALYNTAVIPVSYVAIREYVDGMRPERLTGRA